MPVTSSPIAGPWTWSRAGSRLTSLGIGVDGLLELATDSEDEGSEPFDGLFAARHAQRMRKKSTTAEVKTVTHKTSCVWFAMNVIEAGDNGVARSVGDHVLANQIAREPPQPADQAVQQQQRK